MKADLSGDRQGRSKKSNSDCQDRFVFERETEILDLVRLRVSQMNQCPIGISSHVAALREKGVPEAKIRQVETWCNSSLFNQRESIALALAELISVSCETVTESVLKMAQDHFTREEITYLVVAIVAVNDFAEPTLSDRETSRYINHRDAQS